MFIRTLCILFFGLISGCTAMMAGITYPSSSTNLSDKSMVLLFDYTSDNGTHSIYYRWDCSYTQNWAANTGQWRTREITSEHAFVKKLSDKKYLYISLPSCLYSDYTANVVEFNLSEERPKPKLVIASVIKKECSAYEEKWRVSNYRQIPTYRHVPTTDPIGYFPPSDWKMNSEEMAALMKIQEYEYIVLPIDLRGESDWPTYPDYAKILYEIKYPINGKEFWSIYAEKHPEKNFVPYSVNSFPRGKNAVERVLASAEEDVWVFPSKEKGSKNIFSVRKKYSQSFIGEAYMKAVKIYGKDGGFNLEVFDPTSKTIAVVTQKSECFY